MAKRRAISYVKTYSFGADGTAALPGGYGRTPGAARQSPARSLARPARRRTLPARMALLLAAALSVLLLAGYLGAHGQANAAARRNDLLVRELHGLNQENAALEEKLESARDPTYIHAIAAGRLGMVQPTAEQIIRIDRVPPAAQGLGNGGVPSAEPLDILAFARQILGL